MDGLRGCDRRDVFLAASVLAAFGLATVVLAVWGGIGRWFFVPLGGVVLVLLFALVLPDKMWSRIAPDPNASRVALKDLLGKAQARGGELYAEAAEKDVEEWITQTRDLVQAALGEGEAQRFLSSAGYTFYASDNDPKHRTDVDGRIRRLDELIAGIDSITLRPGFQPRDWA